MKTTDLLSAMDVVALLCVGFSIIAALVLGLARFTVYRGFDPSRIGRIVAIVCLICFALLPGLHVYHLLSGVSVLNSKLYVASLCVSAAAFHAFFAASLQPPGALNWRYALHVIPIILLPILPGHWAIPLSFLLGLGFSLHLLRLLHKLKDQRKYFAMERRVFVLFAVLAIAIFSLGLLVTYVGERLYLQGYTVAIAFGLALAVYALLRFPDLAERIQESVSNAYTASTLNRVDCERALAALRTQMDVEKAYTDETLSLARLAEAVALAPHQLSELINMTFQMSFPRYVRGYRVDAARAMLEAEPKASVLSVGMAVGFSSQSNFYAAFRELTGQTPAAYRSKKET